jgi:hypothetical protein
MDGRKGHMSQGTRRQGTEKEKHKLPRKQPILSSNWNKLKYLWPFQECLAVLSFTLLEILGEHRAPKHSFYFPLARFKRKFSFPCVGLYFVHQQNGYKHTE